MKQAGNSRSRRMPVSGGLKQVPKEGPTMGISRMPPGEALERIHTLLREAEAKAKHEGLSDVELLAGAAAEAAQQYIAAWELRRPIAA